MKVCTQCKSEFDESKVEIPQVLPDRMCAECGTILTEDQIAELTNGMNLDVIEIVK